MPLINPKYIYDAFALIKSKNKFKELNSFLDYFENNFLKTYELDWWNYYNDVNIRTNNPCEGFNNRLNSYFVKNLHFIT